MVPFASLLVPILVSAVVVFIASSIIHMVLPYHRTDWLKLPDEDNLVDAVRRANVPPGDYVAPHAAGPAEMKDPAFQERLNRGPLLLLTVAPGGGGMGKALAGWFVYCVVVSALVAYITGNYVPSGAEYMQVNRLAATSAFLGYGMALAQNSIWFRRRWSTTVKSMLDALLYGLLTGGIFGWLWP